MYPSHFARPHPICCAVPHLPYRTPPHLPYRTSSAVPHLICVYCAATAVPYPICSTVHHLLYRTPSTVPHPTCYTTPHLLYCNPSTVPQPIHRTAPSSLTPHPTHPPRLPDSAYSFLAASSSSYSPSNSSALLYRTSIRGSIVPSMYCLHVMLPTNVVTPANATAIAAPMARLGDDTPSYPKVPLPVCASTTILLIRPTIARRAVSFWG